MKLPKNFPEENFQWRFPIPGLVSSFPITRVLRLNKFNLFTQPRCTIISKIRDV